MEPGEATKSRLQDAVFLSCPAWRHLLNEPKILQHIQNKSYHPDHPVEVLERQGYQFGDLHESLQRVCKEKRGHVEDLEIHYNSARRTAEEKGWPFERMYSFRIYCAESPRLYDWFNKDFHAYTNGQEDEAGIMALKPWHVYTYHFYNGLHAWKGDPNHPAPKQQLFRGAWLPPQVYAYFVSAFAIQWSESWLRDLQNIAASAERVNEDFEVYDTSGGLVVDPLTRPPGQSKFPLKIVQKAVGATHSVQWSESWQNDLRTIATSLKRIKEDFLIYDMDGDIVEDPFSGPPDRARFPFEFVRKSSGTEIKFNGITSFTEDEPIASDRLLQQAAVEHALGKQPVLIELDQAASELAVCIKAASEFDDVEKEWVLPFFSRLIIKEQPSKETLTVAGLHFQCTRIKLSVKPSTCNLEDVMKAPADQVLRLAALVALNSQEKSPLLQELLSLEEDLGRAMFSYNELDLPQNFWQKWGGRAAVTATLVGASLFTLPLLAFEGALAVGAGASIAFWGGAGDRRLETCEDLRQLEASEALLLLKERVKSRFGSTKQGNDRKQLTDDEIMLVAQQEMPDIDSAFTLFSRCSERYLNASESERAKLWYVFELQLLTLGSLLDDQHGKVGPFSEMCLACSRLKKHAGFGTTAKWDHGNHLSYISLLRTLFCESPDCDWEAAVAIDYGNKIYDASHLEEPPQGYVRDAAQLRAFATTMATTTSALESLFSGLVPILAGGIILAAVGAPAAYQSVASPSTSSLPQKLGGIPVDWSRAVQCIAHESAMRAIARIHKLRLMLAHYRICMVYGLPNVGKSKLLQVLFSLETNPGQGKVTDKIVFHDYDGILKEKRCKIMFADVPGYGDVDKTRNETLQMLDCSLKVPNLARLIWVLNATALRTESGMQESFLQTITQNVRRIFVVTKVDSFFRNAWNDVPKSERTQEPAKRAVIISGVIDAVRTSIHKTLKDINIDVSHPDNQVYFTSFADFDDDEPEPGWFQPLVNQFPLTLPDQLRDVIEQVLLKED